MKKNLLVVCTLLLSVALIAGCGGPQRPPGMPQLYSCVLTFQFEDGTPVADAGVSLVPDSMELAQWSISGRTDSSGVARIHTRGDFVGAPSGTYTVTVRKEEVFQTNERDEDGELMNDVRLVTPTRYADSSLSPFKLEIGNAAVTQTFQLQR